MIALVLCGGHANKLYPLTRSMPKALLPIVGRPILSHLMDKLICLQGLDAIWVVIDAHDQAVFDRWQKNYDQENTRKDLPIRLVDNAFATSDQNTGAIADLWAVLWRGQIQEDVLVVAGEQFFDFNIQEVLDQFLKKRQIWVVGGQVDPDQIRLRRSMAKVNAEGRLTVFKEKPQQVSSSLTVHAIYFFTKDMLPMIGDYLEDGQPPECPGYFIEWLYTRKPVHVYQMNGTSYYFQTIEEYADIQLQCLP